MSTDKTSLWSQVKNNLKEKLPAASFETWLGGVDHKPSANGEFKLVAPNGFIKRGLERQYLDAIQREVERLGSGEKEVIIEVGSSPGAQSEAAKLDSLDSPSTSPEENPEKPSYPEAEGKIPLNEEYTFENFVQGKNNHLASAASQAVAESPAQAYNPLFLYAKVGLGKTHLLHAIGNYLVSKGVTSDKSRVIYTSSERFAIDMIQAIRQNDTEQFRRRYRDADGLLLDDVQFLENKEGTQEELFHTFNELYENGKQIVFTSDRPPDELSDLQDRLVSRFRWGLVADIQPPNFETRVAILRKKANQKGFEVSDEVLELIATRITTNVRALEGALIKTVARADLSGGPMDVEDVKDFLPQPKDEPNTLTVEAIKEETADNYDLEVTELEGPSRKKQVARARHIAIYLSRELTDNSYPALGSKFGNRDHSTVMHSCNKIKEMMEETPLLYEEVQELEDSLRSKYRSGNK